MLDEQTRQWLLQRAVYSREQAIKADDPTIAAVHMELHHAYTRQAQQQPRPILRPSYQ